MARRAAGDHVHAVDGGELLGRHAQLVELDALLAEAVVEQALEGLGLLGDLLLHEVGVAAEGGGGGVPIDVDGRGVAHDVAGLVEDGDGPVGLEQRVLVVRELRDVARDARERHDVGCGVGAVGGGRHDERRSVAGDGDLTGNIGTDARDGPGALEARAGVAQGGDEVASARTVPRILDEVRDDLGVGLGGELVTGGHELGPEVAEVLDDAVVDDGDAPRAVAVRVGVAVGRRSVGRPARVRDARGAHGIRRLAALDERGHASRALHAMERAVGRENLEPRGVVSAVLERLESLQEEGRCLVAAGVSYDAAHLVAPLRLVNFNLLERLEHGS